ncbi:MAG TPA: ribonuclease P protein component [Candidatus Limnocylindria bacterium]|nr:ribonuclease P protein component [Candidatus Limnocylindria bacterium]
MNRAARLRRSSDIALVRAEGRAVRRAGFVARVRRHEGPELRLAVVAPGSVGGSVTRNRVRRRVREAFRRAIREGTRTSGADLLVTARREAAAADFKALEADAASLLREAIR